MKLFRTFLIVLITSIAQQLDAKVYYASPTGTDAEGTSRSAPGNLFEMTWKLEAGDELILLDGQYDLTETWWINLKGTPTAHIIIHADENATPILDFRNQSDGLGVGLQGEYTHLKGITIRYAAHIGIWNFGTYNILERLDVYGNYDTGIQNCGGGHNMIKNCDSHDNFDYKHLLDNGSLDYGGNADGFADKWGEEPYSSNVYIGCRAWSNSDDGFDFWERISGEKPSVVINCIAYHNGPETYDMTNHPRVAFDKEWFDKCGETLSAYKNHGNGNGFKLGGNGTKHNVELYRCQAVGNRSTGFDQNDNAGKMKIINCMSFQNGYNYGFYRENPFSLDIHNCISLEPTWDPNNHFWTGEPNNVTQSHNSWNDGFSVSASDFESLDVENLIIAPRNADGSLPETPLFQLKSTASDLIDKGIVYPAMNFEGDEITNYVDYNGTAPDLGCYEYTPTKVSYTLSLDETFASGTTIDRDIITLTFGEAGGPDFLPAMENPIDDTFVFYTQGNGINGHQEKGTFYFFTPTKNGLLTIGIRHNKNKMLYIEEDGIVMPDFNGIICSEEEALSYALSFQVKAGSTYKVYGAGTKLGFYGFVFDTDCITVKADDVTMTYGDEIPKLSYTQINGNVTGIPKITTTARKYSPVGTYPIIVEKGSVQEENVFYSSGTLTIIPAPLSVVVNDETITRGEAIPPFTLTYDGWRNNDTEETALKKKPTIKTSAYRLSPAGVYDIFVEGGEAPNYAFNYQSGRLTILPASGDKWLDVGIKRKITHTQPMTGLCLWPWKADDVNDTHGKSIQLEFNYFLPCKVVKGCKEDGTIIYDWSYFDETLCDVASRGHQLVARFRYEYPEANDVDGKPGTTAVPDYIKKLPDYNETYSEIHTTYYADWSNSELQRFTLQFYTDFCQRYAHDPRLAFLEVGFGHWSEYHINAEPKYGKNFPSLEYQKKFLLHMNEVADGLPWLVSKNAADNSPIVGNEELIALPFGVFEDSFMGEFQLNGGYKSCYDGLKCEVRWQTGVYGGEIGPDYKERYNLLNPEGLYGHTFEEIVPEYHITFMIDNAAPDNPHGTPERIKQASMATGYRFVVKKCATDGNKTLLLVGNEGIAPIYRDAFFAIGDVRSETSLMGLLPNEELWVEIATVPRPDGEDIKIVSDYILPQQEIEFDAYLLNGDVNGDNIVNAADIVEVINYITDKPSAIFNASAADMNNDGVINADDVTEIMNIIMTAK